MAQAQLLDFPGESRPVLVCDLDGTLIRTEMLDETFWAALAARWTAPFEAFASLLRGRGALKQRMAAQGTVDPALLPYRNEVVSRLRAWRLRGGRTALVTCADQAVADRIANHLGVFDEVHGSDGVRNLRGQAKADFLAARFGSGNYSYIGGSAAGPRRRPPSDCPTRSGHR